MATLYDFKITKEHIEMKYVHIVKQCIRHYAKRVMPADVTNLILFFYAKPTIMNLEYMSKIRYILYCPLKPQWVSLKKQIRTEYNLQQDKVSDIQYQHIKVTQSNWLSCKWNVDDIFHVTTESVDEFHTKRILKLNTSLESDKWTKVKVPMDIQIEVTRIQNGEKKQTIDRNKVEHKNIDPKDAILIHIHDKKLLSKTTISETINSDVSISTDDDFYDDVDNLKFKSTKSLLCLIKLISEYIEWTVMLPSVAYDVGDKLIELFTLFNSKTCQLVLGAHAMQTVNLKAITAKNLALAQQSICVLIILLPQIHKEWFSNIIPNPLIMAQINGLNEDLEQHSNEIFKKLISIMEELINYKFDGNEQYKSYLLTETINSTKQHNVHPSISTLMSDCERMHRIMLAYMQSYQIRIIFKPIVAQFELKLTALITKIHAVHLVKNNQNEGNINDENKPIIGNPSKRDMTQAFHSLNTNIKFISDKLNGLNCEAQHLVNLCIEID